ncbi:hypothetical protein SNEBB_004461 [Seison nebaliae]|nr:hypothetical protein SNEBB_004461 [Seison nebaliae]
MPHKVYHGKTGRVFNVTKRAIGVIVNKKVRGRIIPKKVNVRVEHINHSKCRTDFLDRVKRNEQIKLKVKKGEIEFQNLKRIPKQPLKGHVVEVKANKELIKPIKYEFIA